MTTAPQATIGYAALLRRPGARLVTVTTLLGSLPVGVVVPALVLMAADATGSYAVGGRVAAAYGLANALGSAVQGRLVDRFGPTKILLPAAIVHAVGMLLAVGAAAVGSAEGMGIGAAYAGLCFPQVIAASRTAWTLLIVDGPARTRAYALVHVTFEVAVAAGPAVVAAARALGSPAAAVLLAAATAGVGAVVLVAGTRSLRWTAPGTYRSSRWLGALVSHDLAVLLAVGVLLGVGLGAVQVAVLADTGPLPLIALSVGSLLGGLGYGAREWPGRSAGRLALLLAGTGYAVALLAVVGGPWPVSAVLILVGLLMGGAVVAAQTVLEEVRPPGTRTEAFTLWVTATVAGIALGGAVGGTLAESAPVPAAALTAAGAVLLGSAVLVLRRRRFHRLSSRS